MSDEKLTATKPLETAEFLKDKNRDDILQYRSTLTRYLIKSREFIDELIKSEGVSVYNISALDDVLIIIGRMYYRIRVLEKNGNKFEPSDEIDILDNLKLLNLIGNKYTKEYKKFVRGKSQEIKAQYDHCMMLNLNYLKFISDAYAAILPVLEELEIQIKDTNYLYDTLNNIGQTYYCMRSEERKINLDYQYDDEYAKNYTGEISPEDLEIIE